jgi:hypothetical protein
MPRSAQVVNQTTAAKIAAATKIAAKLHRPIMSSLNPGVLS